MVNWALYDSSFMLIKGFMTIKLGTILIQRSESELDTLYVKIKEVLCQ